MPNKLFKNLKEQLIEYNQLGTIPKLNLAKAAYLLNLLYYIPLNAKDKYEDGWIPICSEPYKNLKHYYLVRFAQTPGQLKKFINGVKFCSHTYSV